MGETPEWQDERRNAMMRRLMEYGEGWTDPTAHEQDCVYAVGVIRWLERRLAERDKFIVSRGEWNEFAATLPKDHPT